MKKKPLDLIPILAVKQIDKKYYREGTRITHRQVWMTKARHLGYSYPTYLRYVKRPPEQSALDEEVIVLLRELLGQL